MKDYIDNYREAYDREFSEDGDKDIRKNFWKMARRDIIRAKRTGLIQEICVEDYIQSNYRPYSKISEKTRNIIEKSIDIPAALLSDHLRVSISAIRQIRNKYKNK